MEQGRNKLENYFQSMSTIQSSTLEDERSLDMELLIELVRI